MIQPSAFKGAAIVRFLNHLLRHIGGKLLVIWDGLPAHRGRAVKDCLRQGATQRIHLERLPAYAPDLNPDEGIWRYLKQVEMKNLCCHNLDELHHELRQATARLRHKTDVILACFRAVHLAEPVLFLIFGSVTVNFALDLGQVYAALAYYYQHKSEVDVLMQAEADRAETYLDRLAQSGRLIRVE